MTDIETPQPGYGHIHKAILEVSAAVGVIAKGRTNNEQHFQFRGIDTIVPPIQEAMLKHGVTITPEVLNISPSDKEVQGRTGPRTVHTVSAVVKFTLTDTSDGSYVVTSMLGEAADFWDKAANKAISSAVKYFLFYTFWIPSANADDVDNDSYDFSALAAAPDRPQQPRQQQGRPATQQSVGDKVRQATGRPPQNASGPSETGESLSKAQWGKINGTASTLGWDNTRLFQEIETTIGHTVTDLNTLTKRQASKVIERLVEWQNGPEQDTSQGYGHSEEEF